MIKWAFTRNEVNKLKKTIIFLLMFSLFICGSFGVCAEATNDTMWIAGINLLVKKVGYSCDDFEDKKIFELLRMADF